jgi:hypothetical protein
MENKTVINPRYIYAVILFAAAVSIFWVIKNLFFFDEDVFVTAGNGDFMSHIWQRSLVVKLTFKADYLLWGANPYGYHLTSLFLHLINAVLAMLVLKELLKPVVKYFTQFQLTAIPVIFFTLFLFTPVHSEPLCYILARGGSVVSLFCLLSVLFFLRSLSGNKILLGCSLLSFLLALFSYEISWLLPLIILSITVFLAYVKSEPLKKYIPVVLLYFLVFIVWFIIKVVFIDKLVVSDYNDGNLFKTGLLTLIKNNCVLFLRNFIPPFKNATVFTAVSAAFCLLLIFSFYKLFKQSKPLFYFSALLLLITVLGFSSVTMIGIDSHDSESERYIYFSSSFAIIGLAVLLTAMIKNKIMLVGVVLILTGWYAATLFKTVNYYDTAGAFSKQYLSALDKEVKNNDNVFIVNMPLQYEGALLFRAKSRMAGNTDNNVSILQEYLSYLKNKSNRCVVLSTKALYTVPTIVSVSKKSIDSIAGWFPEVIIDQQQLKISVGKNEVYPYSKSNTVVVALKDSVLYFFR